MEAEPSNPPEVYKNAAGFAPPVVTTTVSAGGRTYVNLDSKNWQGGTTTVVTPSSAAPLFADLQSHTMMEERKVNRGGGRKSASLKDESLCPEEEERRRMRRERNKLAAARCRKRRVDQTETLQDEVNMWESKKKAMEADNQQVTVTTTVRLAAHQKPKRPSSLLVGNGSNSLSSLNIPIETPTNVMNQLDFNALMDGRTGLTPTNILTPIMVNMTTPSSSSGFLQTPTVSTPSCGSQQRTNV